MAKKIAPQPKNQAFDFITEPKNTWFFTPLEPILES